MEPETLYSNPNGMNSSRPFFKLISLALFVFSGIIFFNALGLAFLLPFYEYDILKVSRLLTDPILLQQSAIPLLVLQGTISLGGFILMPLIYLVWIEKRGAGSLFSTQTDWSFWSILAIIFLVPAFMPFNGIFIEWNESMQLPAFLHDFEVWAMEKENSLKDLTKAITNLQSPGEFMLGVLVVAAIPAMGEELVFRGLVQNKIREATGWTHGSIWLAGFLFSAIHIQFYGLLPRMLLGVLFGYIYLWSNNLWLPILAHFVNNFLTLTLLYFKNMGMTDFDVESTESIPWPAVVVSMLVSGLLLYWLRNYFLQQKTLRHG
ncbi:MAG: CPBP family intramembrane metalloprotease [Cytophagales bacterium]|nr:CPBP family intramembrane metalloprotease [Cytophagales bacterium]